MSAKHAKAMVYAVTEGEEKPLKYPVMFRAADVVVVNKIDLLPHLDFDLDAFLANLRDVNPHAARHPHECTHRPGRRRVVRVVGVATAGVVGQLSATYMCRMPVCRLLRVHSTGAASS